MRIAAPLLLSLAAALASPALAHPHEAETEAPPQASSEFVGRYDGSAMETAMGMIIREDGTFGWGLSVGGLDLRASGTWIEEDSVIIFVSDPKPVPPEFRWLRTEKIEGEPLLKVQFPNGRQLDYVDIRLVCLNAQVSFYEIPEGGLVLDEEECAQPLELTLELPGAGVLAPPQTFNLAEKGWASGETILTEFHRNDLGVADFDGTMGQLRDGVLVVQGPLGAMELRKLTPPSE